MAALVLALAIFVSVVRQAAVADLVGGEYRSELTGGVPLCHTAPPRPAFLRAQPSDQKEGGPALFVDNIWTTPLSSKLISIHQPFSSIRLRPALFVP